jgi:hypothetical protein
MAPSDLAVHADRNEVGDRLTLHWKGTNDVNRLGSFFEKAAGILCAGKCRYHVSFVTTDGLKEFEPSPGHVVPIPAELTSTAGFIQFECIPLDSSHDLNLPIIVVYANLDQHASNIDNLQQSIGIFIPRAMLGELNSDIAHIISTSTSTFFKGQQYREDHVHRSLSEIRSDLNRGLALG